MLRKLRELLPNWLKLQLYYALVHSRLKYCVLVWGTTTNTENIFLLQKKAVRIAVNLGYIEHTRPLLKKDTSYYYRTCSLTYNGEQEF